MDALKWVGIASRASSADAAPGSRRPHPSRRHTPTRLLSATGSLIVHALLLGALAAVVWRTAGPPARGPEVTINYDALAFAESPQPVGAAAPAAPPVESQPPRPHEVAIQFEPSPAEPLDTAPDPIPSLATLTADSAPPSERITPSADLPAFAPTPAIGGGASAADPAASGAGHESVVFAGLGASNARSVVFAVDASGSMVTSLPLVLAEVERAVSRLSPTQKFGVVLFRRPPASSTGAGGSGGGVEVFAPVLVRATSSARERLRDWLASVAPVGRSVPLAGLERAIAYKPDAIFLLSRAIERSGGSVWDSSGRGGPISLASTLSRIEALNPLVGGRRSVVIQTIQFLDDDPTGTMQEIGRLHGARTDATGRTIAGYRVVGRGEDLGGGR